MTLPDALATPNQLPAVVFDAIVIGAGPAGSAAAALLASRGWHVLLVEKSTWPRDKVCGGCLNADAIETLHRLNLDSVLRGAAITRIARTSRGITSLDVPSVGRAIARSELDAGLVKLATERGVMFKPECTATLLTSTSLDSPLRVIELRERSSCTTYQARVVLVADGINGTSLRDEPATAWRVSRRSWIGVAGSVNADSLHLAADTIRMNIAAGGYVGLVRQSDGRVHWGAAIDPQQCRQNGGPKRLVERILKFNGYDLSVDTPLQGTGLLTRHRRNLGGHRMLCIGDACGYVEPFTGEGIAWALAAAEAAVSLLPEDAKTWPTDLPAKWKRLHQHTVGRQQRQCRVIRQVVRHAWLWKIAAATGEKLPRTVDWFVPASSARMAGEFDD